MPKTYTSVPSVSTGDVYAASVYNTMTAQNLNNLIVPPMCRLVASGTTTLTTATDTIVNLGTSEFDTDGMGTTGASARITIQTAGVYVVSYSIAYNTSATGNRWTTVTKNGVGSAAAGTGNGWTSVVGSAAASITATSTFLMNLAASDYLQLQGYQSTGGNLTVGVVTNATFLQAVWVGRTS